MIFLKDPSIDARNVPRGLRDGQTDVAKRILTVPSFTTRLMLYNSIRPKTRNSL